jgi:hypothetical protein
MEREGLSMSSFLSSPTPSFWSKVYNVRSWLLFIGLWVTIIYLIQQQLSMQQHAEYLILNLRQEIDSIRKETSEALTQVLKQQQQQQQQPLPNSPSPPRYTSFSHTSSSTNDPDQTFNQWPLLPSTSTQPKVSIILTAFAANHRNFRPLINQVEAICSSTSKDLLHTLEFLIVFPKGSLDTKRQEVHQLLQTTLTSSSSSTLPFLRLVSPSASSPFSSPSSLGWTYAQANNAGAALARGTQLIFLGERVIPASPSWLSSLLKAKLEASQRETPSTSPKLGLVTGRVLQYPSSSSSLPSSSLENLEVRSAGIDFQFHTASSFLPPPSFILNELRTFSRTSSSSKRGASATINNIEGYTPQSFNVPLAFFRLRGVIANNSRATNKYSSNSKPIGEPIVVSASSQSVFLIEKTLFLEMNGLETSLDDEVVSRNPHRYLEAEDNLALLDFCLRLHAKGYSIFYEADSIFVQQTFLPSASSPSSRNTPSLPSVGHWSSSLLLGATSDALNGVTSLSAARSRFLKKWYLSLEALILSRRALGKTGSWGIQGIMYDMYGGCTGWNIETVNLVTPLEHLVPMNLVANQQTFCHGFPTHIGEALQR